MDYDSKILIYDNNELFADKTICLYFNEGTDEWIIPDYPNCSNLDGGKLIGCISDLNNIDFIDVNANQKNYNSYLKALNSTSFKLIANNIEEYLGKGFEKNNKFVSFEMAGSDLVTYCIPNDNRTFTVLPLEYDKKLELSVENKNYLMNVSVDNCLSAEFGIDGEVSINNNDGDFKISITGNTGYHPLSWPTIEILGNGTTSPNVKKSEKGFVLEGDNLENVTLLARYSEFDTNKVKSKKLTFNTDKSSVLIGESNGNLTVSTDNDNDGVYETLIKSTDSTIEAAKLKSLKLSGIELNPTFDPDTLVYNVTVPHSVSSVELSCTLKENNSATISVNSGETMDLDTTKNYNADLNVGDNKIIISVSGANLSSTSYTINIKRLADDSTTEATTQNINSTTNQNGTPNTGDTGAPTKIVLCILLISLFVISLTLFIGIKRKHKMM